MPEFPELLTAAAVLEVGCGAGNSIFPLLTLNPAARVWACDFSPTAVSLVRAHPGYGPEAAAGRLSAFVADITRDDLPALGGVPRMGVDICTCVFVLSAIAPRAMPAALAHIATCLRPGGRVLVRDYAAGDYAAARLGSDGRQQVMGDNDYVRSDGTRAFFFSEARQGCDGAVVMLTRVSLAVARLCSRWHLQCSHGPASCDCAPTCRSFWWASLPALASTVSTCACRSDW